MTTEPIFDAPRKRKVILRYPIYANGKGLPKDGVLLYRDGEEVTIESFNGVSWYVTGHYGKQRIQIPILPIYIKTILS